jgi:hypothetical protein
VGSRLHFYWRVGGVADEREGLGDRDTGADPFFTECRNLHCRQISQAIILLLKRRPKPCINLIMHKWQVHGAERSAYRH